MQAIISESDGRTYEFSMVEPIALWPEGMPVTDIGMAKVITAYTGDTLTESDVIRILGN